MLEVRLESFGLNASLLRPPKRMGRIHHHQEIELNYLFRGGVTYMHRWVRHELVPRRLTIFWGAVPHTVLETSPDSEMAWITAPLPWVLQWGLPEDFIHALMDGHWITEERGADEPERFAVSAWVAELSATPGGRHEALLLELQACFLRLATQVRATPSAKARPNSAAAGLPTPGGRLWESVAKLARFVAERFTTEIDVEDIAKAAGLHPKYAMKVFRERTGETIHDYLLHYRITHAQRQLIMTDQKVVDVAFSSGFSSLSAFYSGFMRVTGETPSGFRHRVRNLAEFGAVPISRRPADDWKQSRA